MCSSDRRASGTPSLVESIINMVRIRERSLKPRIGLDPSDDAGTTCAWVLSVCHMEKDLNMLSRGKDWPWRQIKADVHCKLSTRRVLCWLLHTAPTTVFSARCNIYISRLCYDVSVRLSVRLSVTFVHCGHRVQWIPDIFACLHDRWMSLLLTNNASPRSSDGMNGMMPGFLVEEGRGIGYGKIGNCSDIT